MPSWISAPTMTGMKPKLAKTMRIIHRIIPPMTDSLATLVVRLAMLMVRGILRRLSAMITTPAASLAAVEP